MRTIIKQIIKQLTPPIVLSLVKKRLAIYRHTQQSGKSDERRDSLEKDYRERNSGLRTDTMMFRHGIQIKLHPDSRNAFEHFTYISPVMVDEINCFLLHSKGRKSLLDIGSLHGIFSLVFALQSPERRSVAVDASPNRFCSSSI